MVVDGFGFSVKCRCPLWSSGQTAGAYPGKGEPRTSPWTLSEVWVRPGETKETPELQKIRVEKIGLQLLVRCWLELGGGSWMPGRDLGM